MLTALAQRASTEASVLTPPSLLPIVTSLSEADPSHARYLWLSARRHMIDVALALVHAEELHDEKLAENEQWEQLLDEWREVTVGGVAPPLKVGSSLLARLSPPRLRVPGGAVA